MQQLQREWRFLLAVWQANLLAAMEYRVAFLSQVLGMMINNAIYFVFWMLFFERFKEIRGWDLNDMLLLFAVVATGFGAATVFFGNILSLNEIITGGDLTIISPCRVRCSCIHWPVGALLRAGAI